MNPRCTDLSYSPKIKWHTAARKNAILLQLFEQTGPTLDEIITVDNVKIANKYVCIGL